MTMTSASLIVSLIAVIDVVLYRLRLRRERRG